ncbi:hypothetical protein A3A21_01100 [Candidatus Jorgensenbacteria bacterium RIFCSPLOWO2_01_FULL_45_25b]|uniref:Uncharacterized protein n=1 Tax=Candidatus Jorgensenbacteria bacterium RIFCSPLOWO2_01_FULL_45_25b TaxID=1798471 RepID=A0A1F6BV70_9BACT|nr:MAG: hypothetical protein A3A21_01100 [Candidatus Jorgensenbacteria bacterium RIFCSPLOWO2_01_FULL_45_25b]
MVRKKTSLLLALLLISIFGLGSHFILRANPNLLKHKLLGQLGSGVGVFAVVEPNPLNTIAKQLKTKEKELEKKETMLQERENATSQRGIEIDKNILYVLMFLSTLLFILVVINFYLDWKRGKKEMKK